MIHVCFPRTAEFEVGNILPLIVNTRPENNDDNGDNGDNGDV